MPVRLSTVVDAAAYNIRHKKMSFSAAIRDAIMWYGIGDEFFHQIARALQDRSRRMRMPKKTDVKAALEKAKILPKNAGIPQSKVLAVATPPTSVNPPRDLSKDTQPTLPYAESKEKTVTLSKLYGKEDPDSTEYIWKVISAGDMDVPLRVRKLPVAKMKKLQAPRAKGHTVMDAFKRFGEPPATKLINTYILAMQANVLPDKDKIVVLDGDILVDGNHRVMAAIKIRKPLYYIDLSDLSGGDENENGEGAAVGGSVGSGEGKGKLGESLGDHASGVGREEAIPTIGTSEANPSFGGDNAINRNGRKIVERHTASKAGAGKVESRHVIRKMSRGLVESELEVVSPMSIEKKLIHQRAKMLAFVYDPESGEISAGMDTPAHLALDLPFVTNLMNAANGDSHAFESEFYKRMDRIPHGYMYQAMGMSEIYYYPLFIGETGRDVPSEFRRDVEEKLGARDSIPYTIGVG